MAKLGAWVVTALIAGALGACQTTTGQGGGMAGTGSQAPVVPAGMTAAQAGAYCTKLGQTYAEYVGSVGGSLGGDFRGGAAADLDARVAIANCQDGNYAAGIPVLEKKLRDERVTVPPPPTA
ncbi:hypothetical protein [Reyranella sp.]|uniref:hypothetical protein n=1 Tax=Reyranella sp. TaxID=1929291 RepID=UPI003BABE07A